VNLGYLCSTNYVGNAIIISYRFTLRFIKVTRGMKLITVNMLYRDNRVKRVMGWY
jgi:hypothetical protein